LLAVDSLANDAIRQQATPGCVVLVARNGKIFYHKAFGFQTYDSTRPVALETIYDMASVTKICATTLSIMKLYDQGRLNLKKRLGDYLPWVRGSDKENLLIKDILLHQARLKAWIPFSRETIDTLTGIPKDGFYKSTASSEFSVRVADSLFMRTSWRDTLYRRILQSPLEKPGNYIYSDNDFIFLGKIVEAISGLPLEEYVYREFYRPLGLVTAGFRPLDRFTKSQVAPTESEKVFRRQLIQGYVHDPGAAMFGGVAGHAGLFSNAYDIAVIMQLFLNKGVMNGHRYISDTTIEKFTAYQSSISRRGLGFDKPEKDNATRKEPYPTLSASPFTFGHTGFTGTCAWADPKENLIFILLTNRVYPDSDNKLSRMNVRSNIHEQIYKALK
jgi:CubicO group peptidase (beta-lactamase class C family)